MRTVLLRIVRCSIVAMSAAISGCASFSSPWSEPEIAGFAESLEQDLKLPHEAFVGVLTAEQAAERALRYNHAVRLKELEVALAQAKALSASGAMLPSVVAQSDYYRRDRPLMSRSTQSESYSGSTDLSTLSRDISLSWNILDFGLSYVRTRQTLDKALQQEEEARRVRSRVVEETHALYWRAVALDKLAPAQRRLSGEIADAMRLSRLAAQDHQVDPIAQVTFQRDLLNLQRDLNQLDTSLAGVTEQLKTSIGHPLSARLRLRSNRRGTRLPVQMGAIDDDVRLALRQRPEIRQHMYDLRITDEEVTATILQVLPGVTLNRSFARESNSFLYHPHWISWGTQVAVNLINLARLPADLAAVDAQKYAHRQHALATAATIAMQVHVAQARIAVHKRAYRDAERFAEAQRQLLRQVAVTVDLGKAGQQALVRERLATLLAEVRAILAYADLQAAYTAYATARGDEVGPYEAAGVAPNKHNRQRIVGDVCRSMKMGEALDCETSITAATVVAGAK